MPSKPVNKDLTRLWQYSLEFGDALTTAMAQANQLDPRQIEGIHTHLTRMNSRISLALESLTAMKANTADKPTQSPCGSH
jgi:hypothetical protein